MATRVLAQVAAASVAERNWSIYGFIKNDRRVRLSHQRGDARVYCHEAIHLHEKLRRVQDPSALVEISSSDESDLDDNVTDDELDGLAIERLMS